MSSQSRCNRDAFASILGYAPQAYQSEVATGGIIRFILTRLCYSQILSIQDLLYAPPVRKERKY